MKNITILIMSLLIVGNEACGCGRLPPVKQEEEHLIIDTYRYIQNQVMLYLVHWAEQFSKRRVTRQNCAFKIRNVEIKMLKDPEGRVLFNRIVPFNNKRILRLGKEERRRKQMKKLETYTDMFTKIRELNRNSCEKEKLEGQFLKMSQEVKEEYDQFQSYQRDYYKIFKHCVNSNKFYRGKEDFTFDKCYQSYFKQKKYIMKTYNYIQVTFDMKPLLNSGCEIKQNCLVQNKFYIKYEINSYKNKDGFMRYYFHSFLIRNLEKFMESETTIKKSSFFSHLKDVNSIDLEVVKEFRKTNIDYFQHKACKAAYETMKAALETAMDLSNDTPKPLHLCIRHSYKKIQKFYKFENLFKLVDVDSIYDFKKFDTLETVELFSKPVQLDAPQEEVRDHGMTLQKINMIKTVHNHPLFDRKFDNIEEKNPRITQVPLMMEIPTNAFNEYLLNKRIYIKELQSSDEEEKKHDDEEKETAVPKELTSGNIYCDYFMEAVEKMRFHLSFFKQLTYIKNYVRFQCKENQAYISYKQQEYQKHQKIIGKIDFTVGKGQACTEINLYDNSMLTGYQCHSLNKFISYEDSNQINYDIKFNRAHLRFLINNLYSLLKKFEIIEIGKFWQEDLKLFFLHFHQTSIQNKAFHLTMDSYPLARVDLQEIYKKYNLMQSSKKPQEKKTLEEMMSSIVINFFPANIYKDYSELSADFGLSGMLTFKSFRYAPFRFNINLAKNNLIRIQFDTGYVFKEYHIPRLVNITQKDLDNFTLIKKKLQKQKKSFPDCKIFLDKIFTKKDMKFHNLSPLQKRHQVMEIKKKKIRSQLKNVFTDFFSELLDIKNEVIDIPEELSSRMNPYSEKLQLKLHNFKIQMMDEDFKLFEKNKPLKDYLVTKIFSFPVILAAFNYIMLENKFDRLILDSKLKHYDRFGVLVRHYLYNQNIYLQYIQEQQTQYKEFLKMMNDFEFMEDHILNHRRCFKKFKKYKPKENPLKFINSLKFFDEFWKEYDTFEVEPLSEHQGSIYEINEDGDWVYTKKRVFKAHNLAYFYKINGMPQALALSEINHEILTNFDISYINQQYKQDQKNYQSFLFGSRRYHRKLIVKFWYYDTFPFKALQVRFEGLLFSNEFIISLSSNLQVLTELNNIIKQIDHHYEVLAKAQNQTMGTVKANTFNSVVSKINQAIEAYIQFIVKDELFEICYQDDPQVKNGMWYRIKFKDCHTKPVFKGKLNHCKGKNLFHLEKSKGKMIFKMYENKSYSELINNQKQGMNYFSMFTFPVKTKFDFLQAFVNYVKNALNHFIKGRFLDRKENPNAPLWKLKQQNLENDQVSLNLANFIKPEKKYIVQNPDQQVEEGTIIKDQHGNKYVVGGQQAMQQKYMEQMTGKDLDKEAIPINNSQIFNAENGNLGVPLKQIFSRRGVPEYEDLIEDQNGQTQRVNPKYAHLVNDNINFMNSNIAKPDAYPLFNLPQTDEEAQLDKMFNQPQVTQYKGEDLFKKKNEYLIKGRPNPYYINLENYVRRKDKTDVMKNMKNNTVVKDDLDNQKFQVKIKNLNGPHYETTYPNRHFERVQVHHSSAEGSSETPEFTYEEVLGEPVTRLVMPEEGPHNLSIEIAPKRKVNKLDKSPYPKKKSGSFHESLLGKNKNQKITDELFKKGLMKGGTIVNDGSVPGGVGQGGMSQSSQQMMGQINNPMGMGQVNALGQNVQGGAGVQMMGGMSMGQDLMGGGQFVNTPQQKQSNVHTFNGQNTHNTSLNPMITNFNTPNSLQVTDFNSSKLETDNDSKDSSNQSSDSLKKQKLTI